MRSEVSLEPREGLNVTGMEKAAVAASVVTPARSGELLALSGADSCDEREVVIRSPLFVAAIPPAADVAMLDRFRIAAREQRIGATCQRLEHPPANEPDISRIISDSILVNRERRAWGDHKKPIGHETLDLAKQVSVERELEDRAATRFASEFGVGTARSENLRRPSVIWPVSPPCGECPRTQPTPARRTRPGKPHRRRTGAPRLSPSHETLASRPAALRARRVRRSEGAGRNHARGRRHAHEEDGCVRRGGNGGLRFGLTLRRSPKWSGAGRQGNLPSRWPRERDRRRSSAQFSFREGGASVRRPRAASEVSHNRSIWLILDGAINIGSSGMAKHPRTWLVRAGKNATFIDDFRTNSDVAHRMARDGPYFARGLG